MKKAKRQGWESRSGRLSRLKNWVKGERPNEVTDAAAFSLRAGTTQAPIPGTIERSLVLPGVWKRSRKRKEDFEVFFCLCLKRDGRAM